MEDGPEEIASKESKEVRVNRGRPARECSNAGVHRPIQAGISGPKTKGAFSIVVSDYYGHNEDSGDKIIYAGSGVYLRPGLQDCMST
ncbi:hypothetical protein DFH29DRAFT_905765 [Suillus ampliporus]|nr:hypothetical protein DFH29DRAFT_905765 [Suillus ampliporus]